MPKHDNDMQERLERVIFKLLNPYAKFEDANNECECGVVELMRRGCSCGGEDKAMAVMLTNKILSELPNLGFVHKDSLELDIELIFNLCRDVAGRLLSKEKTTTEDVIREQKEALSNAKDRIIKARK